MGMCREILFKAKRIDNGEWIGGSLVIRGTQYFIFTGETKNFGVMINWVWYEVDLETVCEYTGLTDKNGRKIFENDICDRKEKFPEIVTYHDGDWTLDYSYASGKEIGYNYCNLGFYVKERCGVEIIGNIFDNQELLKGDGAE